MGRQLADKPRPIYPRRAELQLLGAGDDGPAWEVFERVCQYMKSRPGPGAVLVRDLEVDPGPQHPGDAPRPRAGIVVGQRRPLLERAQAAGQVEPQGLGLLAAAQLADPQALVVSSSISFFAGGASGSVEALRASQKNGHLLRVRGASGTRFVTIK